MGEAWRAEVTLVRSTQWGTNQLLSGFFSCPRCQNWLSKRPTVSTFRHILLKHFMSEGCVLCRLRSEVGTVAPEAPWRHWGTVWSRSGSFPRVAHLASVYYFWCPYRSLTNWQMTGYGHYYPYRLEPYVKQLHTDQGQTYEPNVLESFLLLQKVTVWHWHVWFYREIWWPFKVISTWRDCS